MALVPSGPQLSTKYVLTGPDGTRCVFNDTTDVDYVGAITEITGLDSPEVRENGENLTGFDGGIHGDFFFGRRPITISGTIYNVVSNEDRNKKITKMLQASAALRDDATLEWTPEGGEASFIKIRRQQPVRVTGGWVKDFQLAFIAADPRIYSTKVESTTVAVAPSENVRATGEETIVGVCASASFIYWSTVIGNTIVRCKTTGTAEVNKTFISALTKPRFVSLDSSHLYWTENEKEISRALLGGTEVLKGWIKPTSGVVKALTVTESYIYFVAVKGGPREWWIGRVKKDGTGLEESWKPAPEIEASSSEVSSIAVGGEYIYYVCEAGIRRIALSGATPSELILPYNQSGTEWFTLAADTENVYWSAGSKMPLRRVKLNGTQFIPDFWESVSSKGTAPTSMCVGGGFLIRSSGGTKTSEIITVEIAAKGFNPTVVTNKGSYFTYPVVRLYAPLTGPIVANTITEETINWEGTEGIVSSLPYLTIDTLNKTVIDRNNANRYKNVNFVNTEWWNLAPGENYIRYYSNTLDEVNPKAVVEFRNAWI